MPRRPSQPTASATKSQRPPKDTTPGTGLATAAPVQPAHESKITAPVRNLGHPLGPPSALIRGELRGSYANHKEFLSEVVKGELIEQTSIPLALILPHVLCMTCGTGLRPGDPDAEPWEIVIPGKTQASVKERLSALDQMAKYGVGTLKEVSIDNVRERVLKTLEAIKLHTDIETADVLYKALEPIWK
jgi:hypothetical protein